MKVVFMGTPEFARRPLEYLYKNTHHDILAVVTGPDKPSGRGQKLSPTAVKEAALQLDIPVFSPESLKDSGFHDQIRKIGADIFVVVAFRILPESLYAIPPHGSINLHGSLLPKYRGAAPINWAIINGETETGLTTFFLQKKVDTGDIIFQEKVTIGSGETFDELYERMSHLAGPVLEKSLNLIEREEVIPLPQDSRLASPAPKLSPEDCLIDWGFPAVHVINFVRGLSSVPGAYTYHRDKKLKILRAGIAGPRDVNDLRPGRIREDKNRLLVEVADGLVELLEVIPEGKKLMSGAEFVRGYHPTRQDILGAKNTKEILRP
ncbi:MAG: methionyl-tRNA formyltransferase [Candidatus Zixiibacteriota bacterium]